MDLNTQVNNKKGAMIETSRMILEKYLFTTTDFNTQVSNKNRAIIEANTLILETYRTFVELK